MDVHHRQDALMLYRNSLHTEFVPACFNLSRPSYPLMLYRKSLHYEYIPAPVNLSQSSYPVRSSEVMRVEEWRESVSEVEMSQLPDDYMEELD